jgi:hypothetical protein
MDLLAQLILFYKIFHQLRDIWTLVYFERQWLVPLGNYDPDGGNNFVHGCFDEESEN